MKNFSIKKFARDERGLSTMEYAVLFVIIIVGALSVWGTLGGKLASKIKSGTDKFETVTGEAEKRSE